jgi:probable phosphoglycerate mutase
MAITLYIVRHGQTVDNLENRIQGHTDSPLTKLGVRQAEAVGAALASEDFAAIYSSDLGRAVATAEIIAARQPLLRQAQGAQVEVRTTPLLRELNLGEVQGLTGEQFAQRWPEEYRLWKLDSVAHRPPGAESIQSAVERCGRFIEQVLTEHSDGDKLAVIVHGGSLKGLVASALELPVDCYRKMAVANAGLSILEIGERPFLRLYNDTCHLQEVTVLDADTG